MSDGKQACSVSSPEAAGRSHGVATPYNVRFVNHYEEYDEPVEVRFTATDPEHIKLIISALAAFYSGDPCECFINGEKAVLEGDWGLHDPTEEAA